MAKGREKGRKKQQRQTACLADAACTRRKHRTQLTSWKQVDVTDRNEMRWSSSSSSHQRMSQMNPTRPAFCWLFLHPPSATGPLVPQPVRDSTCSITLAATFELQT